MAQGNKVCKICNEKGHSQFYCKKRHLKPKKIITKKVRKKVPKKKTKTRSQLVKELDRVFSIYIRLRDDGKGCITCGDIKPWKEMQNCHFYTRGRYPTRWHEKNCHSGCYRCNVLLKGNYIEYTTRMIDMYGRDFIDELKVLSLSGTKISTPDLREMIEDYKNKGEKLKKNQDGGKERS